jgi:hypothetical protein
MFMSCELLIMPISAVAEISRCIRQDKLENGDLGKCNLVLIFQVGIRSM